MTWEALEAAGSDLVRRLGPSALRTVIGHAMEGWPRDAMLRATPGAGSLVDALGAVNRSAGLAYLTGLAAGYAQRAAEISVEAVWSGPGPAVASRSAAARLSVSAGLDPRRSPADRRP
jgi:hypothetical protein